MSILPVPRKKRVHKSVNRSKAQEAEIANRVGGRKTKASGAKAEKGDVRVRGVLRLEAKTTSNKSFSVTEKMFDAIEQAGITSGEIPVFCVEMNGGKRLKSLVILSYDNFMDMYDAYSKIDI